MSRMTPEDAAANVPPGRHRTEIRVILVGRNTFARESVALALATHDVAWREAGAAVPPNRRRAEILGPGYAPPYANRRPQIKKHFLPTTARRTMNQAPVSPPQAGMPPPSTGRSSSARIEMNAKVCDAKQYIVSICNEKKSAGNPSRPPA